MNRRFSNSFAFRALIAVIGNITLDQINLALIEEMVVTASQAISILYTNGTYQYWSKNAKGEYYLQYERQFASQPNQN